jgi:hypothetical protein
MTIMEDRGAGEQAASTSTISISAASASNPAATPTTTNTAAITNNSRGRGVRGNEVLVASLDEFLEEDEDEDEMPASATEFQPIPVPQDEEIEICQSMSRSRRVSFTQSNNVDVDVVQDPLSTVTPPDVETVTKEIRRSSTRVSFTHLSDNINIEDVDLDLPPTIVTDGCNGE